VSRAEEAACRRLADRGADVESVPADDGSVDLPHLLEVLAGRDLSSVLVEGGGALLGSLFDGGLIDKYVAFVAPTIIGGVDAPGPIGGQGIQGITDALRLQSVTVERLGRDIMVVGYPESR
jgi:diaminohydroxyphosphoribosylaminopyrimidine deaminase/5-amino-6-(5-phosphoribosylamino)uracil reductase